MRNKNHQFPEFSDSIVARYKKTPIHAVAGVRLDPHNESRRVVFILQSSENAYNPASRSLVFNYDTDVIELYSDREVMLFERLNKDSIAAGLLVPYEEAAPEIDRTNVLTDSDLDRLVKTPQRGTYETRINTITSRAQLERLLTLLPDNAPRWKETLVRQRLENI